jgi:hypothetical protein
MTDRRKEHQNENKQQHGPRCRQILFNEMKLRLSCETIISTTNTNANHKNNFFHQDPCIFCCILERDRLALVVTNNKVAAIKNEREDGQIGGRKKKSIIFSMLFPSNLFIEKIILTFLLPSD